MSCYCFTDWSYPSFVRACNMQIVKYLALFTTWQNLIEQHHLSPVALKASEFLIPKWHVVWLRAYTHPVWPQCLRPPKTGVGFVFSQLGPTGQRTGHDNPTWIVGLSLVRHLRVPVITSPTCLLTTFTRYGKM